jgi:Mg-chelatase subunit ChlI
MPSEQRRVEVAGIAHVLPVQVMAVTCLNPAQP